MRLRFFACTAALLAAAVTAHATPIRYSFTYTGTGTYTAGETATGSGAMTVDPSTGSITAFSFSDTLVAGSTSSTFTYDLGDLASSTVATGSSVSDFSFQTAFEPGANSSFGSVDFSGAYSGVGSGSTAAGNAMNLADFTSGATSFTEISAGGGTPASVTPEPSSIALLGTGLLGVVGAARRRYAF